MSRTWKDSGKHWTPSGREPRRFRGDGAWRAQLDVLQREFRNKPAECPRRQRRQRQPYVRPVPATLPPAECFHCGSAPSVYALVKQGRELMAYPTCDADRDRLLLILTAIKKRFVWVEERDQDYQAGAEQAGSEIAPSSGPGLEAPAT